MNTDRDTALDELAVAIAEATVDAWLADVIAEAATEAWIREQSITVVTETTDRGGKEDSRDDADCSSISSVDSRARPPDHCQHNVHALESKMRLARR